MKVRSVGSWSYCIPQAMQRHTGYRFAKPAISSVQDTPKPQQDEPVSAVPPVKKPEDPREDAQD
ncbi:MAG: hypothetical protein JO245_03150 [Pseudolabrys sp.]|nr:hypothetical protein [Pseudolabrys sp.]